MSLVLAENLEEKKNQNQNKTTTTTPPSNKQTNNNKITYSSIEDSGLKSRPSGFSQSEREKKQIREKSTKSCRHVCLTGKIIATEQKTARFRKKKKIFEISNNAHSIIMRNLICNHVM